MKPEPCKYCGADDHQPYEDGLIECRDRLLDQRDELRAALESIADEGCSTPSFADCCDGACKRIARAMLAKSCK